MRRKFLRGFILALFLLLVFKKDSLAVSNPLETANNRFGIHILEPSELDLAAKLVNSSGGDWGWVTIPIRADDRYKKKWQAFFDKCKELHLIPILRLATYVRKNYWVRPTEFTLVDFANFLGELDWPTKNKYVVFFNEPNYALEWGGRVDPGDYARTLFLGAKVFGEKDENFFILPAGLDAAAPNDKNHIELYSFLRKMYFAEPQVFEVIDGWVSHSYPNPGFRAKPTDNHTKSIASYRHEINFLKSFNPDKILPVFITETGWKMSEGWDKIKAEYYQVAFEQVWNDDYLVAVTPFLLFAGDGDFIDFSLIKKDGSLSQTFEGIREIKKIAGVPSLGDGILGVETKAFKSEEVGKLKNDSLLSLVKSQKLTSFFSSFKRILARSGS